MMHDAIASVEGKLNESGFGKDSQAYADLRAELMQAELRQIKMFAQLAVAASAESLRFDLSAAMFAANNALENNFAKVFISLGKSLMKKAANQTSKQAAKEVAQETVKETAKNSSKGIAKNLKPAKLNKANVANGNRFGKGGGQASKTTPHKNSLDYVGESHTYVIRDGRGKIMKYGESSVGKNAIGQSKRAEAQIKKLRRQDPSSKYTSEVVREFDSKAMARVSETKYIKTHRKVFGRDSLPLNKNNR